MKFWSILGLAVLLTTPLVAESTQPFNRATVATIMRENIAHFRAAVEAVKEGNDYAAADAFYRLAKANESLLTMAPPQGSQADWDKLFHQLIDAALTGVGGAGAHQTQVMKKALEEILTTLNEGHREFRQ